MSAQADLVEIIWLSPRVSPAAVTLACVIGLPFGAALATRRFRGRTVIMLLNALRTLPSVVVLPSVDATLMASRLTAKRYAYA